MEIITKFFNGWFGNSFTSNELALKEPLDDLMMHLGKCWDSQMALGTNDFVDRTFQRSNWSPTEQLVNAC